MGREEGREGGQNELRNSLTAVVSIHVIFKECIGIRGSLKVERPLCSQDMNLYALETL